MRLVGDAAGPAHGRRRGEPVPPGPLAVSASGDEEDGVDANPASPGDADARGRGRRVLVVDDDEIVRFLLRRILTQAGFDVTLAGDGREALEQIAASRPDLVLLDLVMPVMDGWGVLAHGRGRADFPPVVVVTAHGDRATHDRVLEQGASAYVAKPFTVHELVSTCRRLVGRG